MAEENKQPMADQAADQNPGAQADQAAEQNPGAEPDGKQQAGGKLFTQEDVNRIAAREAKEAQEKLLKQLGIEDFESAKEGLQKFREWQEAQKTEAEKQAERLKKLEESNQTLANENETLKAQLAALEAGVNPDSVADVVVLAKNMMSDDLDMKGAIQKILEKYPHFKASAKEEQKPTFTTGEHKKPAGVDPFVAALGLNK